MQLPESFLQVSDSKYGAQLPNGSWNGMIGDLINKVKPEFPVSLNKVSVNNY